MQLSLITAPAVLPVTLGEAKAHLRIEHTEEDTLLEGLIKAVTARIDGRHGWLRRALITQTWELSLPWFPVCRRIALPMPPLQSVTSVTYFDQHGDAQTLAGSVYSLIKTTDEGYVYLGYGESWPSTYERPDAVTIRFVTGYGATAADVPANIRAAILIEIGELYAGRGDVEADPAPNVTVRRLLNPYKRVILA